MINLIILVFIFLNGAISVYSLKIDNNVKIVRKDCYERQAIGYRLMVNDVYKNVSAKTVEECQDVCTSDRDKCRTFTFGVGSMGNTTCELSPRTVRETKDLKPIGAINDTNFDLYTKKLGCKLVIEEPIATPYNVPDSRKAENNRTIQNDTKSDPDGNNNDVVEKPLRRNNPPDDLPSTKTTTPKHHYLPPSLDLDSQFKPSSYNPWSYHRDNFNDRNIFITSTKVSSGEIGVRPDPLGNDNILPKEQRSDVDRKGIMRSYRYRQQDLDNFGYFNDRKRTSFNGREQTSYRDYFGRTDLRTCCDGNNQNRDRSYYESSNRRRYLPPQRSRWEESSIRESNRNPQPYGYFREFRLNSNSNDEKLEHREMDEKIATFDNNNSSSKTMTQNRQMSRGKTIISIITELPHGKLSFFHVFL